MKISVLGNIIDTKDIYMITPIVGDESFRTSELKTISEPLREKFKDLNHSGFEFEIKFFNDKILVVSLDGRDIWSEWNWFMDDYLTKIKMIEDQVIDLRNTIITFWDKDKSPIPELNFNIKKK